MLKLLYRFSSKKVLRSLQKNRYYVEDPQISFKAETSQIVQQLYFPKKEVSSHSNLQQASSTSQGDSPYDLLKRINTANELLQLYFHSTDRWTAQHYAAWFDRLCYSLSNEDSIMQKNEARIKRQLGFSRLQNNEVNQIQKPVYLTRAQILANQIFTQIVTDSCQVCSLDYQLSLRFRLRSLFNQPIYNLEYELLQNTLSASLKDPAILFRVVQYLHFLQRDILNQELQKEQIFALIRLFQTDVNEQNFRNQLASQISDQIAKVAQKIAVKELSNDHFVSFLGLMVSQRALQLLADSQDLAAEVTRRLHSFDADQSIRLSASITHLKIGNKQLLEYLVWNIIRLKNAARETAKLLPVLEKFRRQTLFVKKRTETGNQIILLDNIAIYQELFNLVKKRLVDMDYTQLASVLFIGYKNYIEPEYVHLLGAQLLKTKQLKASDNLNSKIKFLFMLVDLGMKGCEETVRVVLENKLAKQIGVAGYFPQRASQEKDALDVSKALYYEKYYSEELKLMIQLLWTAFQFMEKMPSERLNLLIANINQLLLTEGGLKIHKQTLRQISTINLIIKHEGKKLFPNLINVQAAKTRSIKQEIYSNPITIGTRLYVKECQHFKVKHAKNIQVDAWHEDVYADVIYTNSRGDSALILFECSNYFQFDAQGYPRPLNQVESLRRILLKARIPVVFISYPQFVQYDQAQGTGLTYIESQVAEILDDVPEQESLKVQVSKLRAKLQELRARSTQAANSEKSTQKIEDAGDEKAHEAQILGAPSKEEEFENDDDTYFLSDEEEIEK